MKKYIIIISALTLLMLGACTKDFIEKSQQPFDLRTTDNFYKTPSDAFEALTAVYDVLQYDGYGNIMLTAEIASDNCYGGAGKSDGPGPQRWDYFQSDNDQNIAAWTKYYKGIYRANILISKLDETTWDKDDSLRVQYNAEAKFLRAYFYFDLVRMFGHVPLITKPLNAGEYFPPQAEPDSVYHQIAVDLKYAITNLPNVNYSSIASGDYGRVTKWAAEGLMGRAFLFYTDYYDKSDLAGVVTKSDAIGYIDDIVTNSGHDLISDFSHLWRAADMANYAGENNKETVWAIKYTFKGLKNWSRQDGNRLQVFFGLRGQILKNYADGWGFLTVLPEFWNAFDPADTRKTSSIVSFADESLTFNANDQRQFTGYVPKKYMPTSDASNGKETTVNLGGDFQIDNFDDYMVIRFADVLLMGAELGSVNAQSYFDKVRDRAFKDQAHRLPVTKNFIMQERRFELAFEGHRYWDLIRQSMDVAKQAIDHADADPAFSITFRPETGGLLQIPQSQINISNGTIAQNAGW